jgi:serine/threonine-protein kinase
MSLAPDSVSYRVREGIQPGTVVDGSYRILGLLGHGGMGDVYEAEHLRLGSKVALKVLRGPADDHAARQLLREARLTAGLASDHVVRLSDCGTLADGSPYAVMERLRGEDLRTLLARAHSLSVQQSLRIVLEICAGLTDLHSVGIVHRDLKPANVFVLHAVGASRCKLLDLGVARSGMGSDTSRSVSVVGSVRYMASEQLVDGKRVAQQTDVYAAGVILYQCLTGELPHDGETVEAIMFSILNRRPRPVSELRAEVSAALSALVMRAIECDASLRPASAAEFASALSSFLVGAAVTEDRPRVDDATLAELPPIPGLPSKRRWLHWSSVGLAALALVALLSFRLVSRSAGAAPPATSSREIPHSGSTVSAPSVVASTNPEAAVGSQQLPSPLPPLPERADAPLNRDRLPSLRHSNAAPHRARVPDADLALERNPYAP